MLSLMSEPTESRRERAARRAGEFPPAPESLPRAVLDSHTHLDITVSEAGVPGGGPADDPVAVAIALATKVGVDRLVQVGVDVASSRWGADTADRYPAVLATVALHPNEAPRLSDLDEALREIEALAARDRVRGIGETGMDFFRTGDEGRAAQEQSFRAHIAIAKRYDKTLVIHDRDAHADVLRILDDEGAPDRVVLHCFSGDADFARECVRRGYLLSFAGTVTFGSATALREAAALTPMEQMLVETDAPYLTPMPYRGRPNASYLIPLTVRALAATTGSDLDELCAAISATGDRAFGPW
ncbi:TatD family hydrolase [Micromonospora noduli]|uniref:Metal-dependent hydrolase n=1 Tax=Micromonospora noduli TaxID=709876 RepID=A0A328NFJ0_9ACTN|nr:TatD family hydrolase [Micromonospora noduli]KAB1918918.1 TatD family deoxyribonuclease [Micromonospora noduli]RAO06787.1 putative metal-dependent hydrolase [Micromonospora noduli]RAO16187.1 putative metal-dependent hydrolase [Micromonospora noduli]RAO21255.1 putative metal-dependent hydrolase [Micromonospora noduli]RAO23275.1 putative metal-dependent hydrolase [Micromonospora noduli]